MSFLISYNLLYFKVYFVCHEDCYFSFLLLPICMEYIFPFSHFSLYVSWGLKWVSCRQHIYGSWFCIHSVKFNKAKSWFFDKINKIDKLLARLIKKKRENKINKIRNEKGDVTTVNVEIQRIIRDYYEQVRVNKMDNLEETDRFLEKFNLPRVNQEEIMNNSITSTEIEVVIKISPQKSPGPWLHRRILSNI